MQRSVLIEFGPRLFTFNRHSVPIKIGWRRSLPQKQEKGVDRGDAGVTRPTLDEALDQSLDQLLSSVQV
jgi:hypothetical protein